MLILIPKDGLTPLHCAFKAEENCAAVVRVLAKDYHANLDATMQVSVPACKVASIYWTGWIGLGFGMGEGMGGSSTSIL